MVDKFALPPLLRTKHLIKVFFLDATSDSFKRLSLNGIRPDAILLVMIKWLLMQFGSKKKYGLNVPDNIKIVGFDNTLYHQL